MATKVQQKPTTRRKALPNSSRQAPLRGAFTLFPKCRGRLFPFARAGSRRPGPTHPARDLPHPLLFATPLLRPKVVSGHPAPFAPTAHKPAAGASLPPVAGAHHLACLPALLTELVTVLRRLIFPIVLQQHTLLPMFSAIAR